MELDAAVRKAAEKAAKGTTEMSEEEKIKLMSTEQSLKTSEVSKIPSSISGLEKFSLSPEVVKKGPALDKDNLFNLPTNDD